uniref:Uncharacterized protein n=1 Tax=Sphenodon punctatus TaxID=8508 RepID=A0A8D0HEQ0_SPHPU
MEVLSESSSKSGGYRLFTSYSRHSSEMKQSGLGSQCTGLFSTTVLGGSSSAPNLQDYARSHGKKFAASLTYKDGRCDLCSGWLLHGTLPLEVVEAKGSCPARSGFTLLLALRIGLWGQVAVHLFALAQGW